MRRGEGRYLGGGGGHACELRPALLHELHRQAQVLHAPPVHAHRVGVRKGCGDGTQHLDALGDEVGRGGEGVGALRRVLTQRVVDAAV